jgi:hypothetical protein
MYLLLLLIIISLFILQSYNKQKEHYEQSDQCENIKYYEHDIGLPFKSQHIKSPSLTQLYDPSYCYRYPRPIYIGKYPYYHFVFNHHCN